MAAHREASLGAEPAFIPGTARTRVAHHHLCVMRQVRCRERTLQLHQRMLRMSHGDEGDIHEEVPEEPGRYTGRHHDIGALTGDGFLGARQYGVVQLQLGVRAGFTQFRDDAQQSLARERLINHQRQLRLPAAGETVCELFEGAQFRQQGTRLSQQSLAVCGQDRLAALQT